MADDDGRDESSKYLNAIIVKRLSMETGNGK